MSMATPQKRKSSSEPAKRKRGRPPGSKTTAAPVAEMLLQEVCPNARCKLTTDAGIVVKGAPTRYVAYDKEPYNMVKKQKVRCPCGQLYWRFTAIYSENQKVGLVYES